MATTHTISEIQSIVSSLAAEYGVQRIYLFGSYARGDMTATSDIDLRVDKGAVRGLQLASLLLDLEESLTMALSLMLVKPGIRRNWNSLRVIEIAFRSCSSMKSINS